MPSAVDHPDFGQAPTVFDADTAAETARATENAAIRMQIADDHGCDAWVATDLSILHPERPDTCPEDISEDGKSFRRLSPDHFVSLKARYAGFKRATNNRLDGATREVHSRFASLRRLAEGFYQPPVIADARKRLTLTKLPSPNQALGLKPQYARFTFPADSPHRCSAQVTRHGLAQVDAIRPQALGAGWTEAELYQTRGRFAFPYGSDYGLVCFVRPEQRLGQVTPKAVEVIQRAGHSLHFYRTTGANP
jgi:hypothetical protein